jgi:cysteine synthase
MPALHPASDIADRKTYDSAVTQLRRARVLLPLFSELADPSTLAPAIDAQLRTLDADAPQAANLFRVHWYNDAARRGRTQVPAHLQLTSELTGVRARIVVALGDRFPLISAHKVLAAYACLIPRLVTGRFDPAQQRAIWPSTGNYCRGGVAISRIVGCRGVAVLPAGMSQERFRWLEQWVNDPADIVRTPGSESNVKEIYDQCAELAADDHNVILNQFSEFGNYLVHYLCTGRALEHIYRALHDKNADLSLSAFVAATGSAGTLAAGDYLKERYGSRIVAVEPIECPTMLYNGYGEHNIQGIGDKHIPLIHNVMNTDVVAGVSDKSCDGLHALFNSDSGREYLKRRRAINPELVDGLSDLGLSGIANVLAAIKTARRLDLGEDDVVLTVATDGAQLYRSERERYLARAFPRGFDEVSAAEVYAQHMLGSDSDHLLELSQRDRLRIFNLGYFTWVEQRGISLPDFDSRKQRRFWRRLQELLPQWDRLIAEFNSQTGLATPASAKRQPA